MGEETFNGEKWIKKDRERDQFLALNEMPFMFAFEAVYEKWRAKIFVQEYSYRRQRGRK